MTSPSENTSSMGINFFCQGYEHACDIPHLLGHPFPFFRPDPCVATHLASVDSVIILVRISASTFGFMGDAFLCMVHAFFTATPEYAKANH